MKVYITKYALTEGIIEMEVSQSKEYPRMVSVDGNCLDCYHGDEWHMVKSSAIARAEEMRIKKIQSLRKSISKMEALKFQ